MSLTGAIGRGTEEDGAGKGKEEGEVEKEEKEWLVRVTLSSGFGLPIRDRTGE